MEEGVESGARCSCGSCLRAPARLIESKGCSGDTEKDISMGEDLIYSSSQSKSAIGVLTQP